MVLLQAVALAIAVCSTQPDADYQTLIDEYLASGSARVPHLLADWPYSTLNNGVTDLVAPRPDAPYHPGASVPALVRWLQAAAIAHLEAGRVSLQSTRPRASGFICTGRMLIDRLRSLIERSRSQRSKLLDVELKALDAGEGFVARWLAAGGVLLQGTSDLGSAYQNFKAAADAAPDSADLRLGLGTAIETAATSSTLTVLANSGSVADPRQAARNYRLALLSDAEAQFTAALKLDPALYEARVRLGRILLLRGKRTEAATALERCAPPDRRRR